MAKSLLQILLPARAPSSRPREGRWLAALLALGVAAPALSACGFQPLYAQQGVVANLRVIDVVAPQGRTGFLLREHLDDALARNRDETPAYRMTLAIGEARYPRGVTTDAVATRYEYVLTADYALTRIETGKIAKRGRVRVELTYDSADQPYGSITAQQDAADRAAEEVARKIQLELATWLATGEPSGTKATPTTTPAAKPAGPRGAKSGA
jgi:LPS-assembly lipoprotein